MEKNPIYHEISGQQKHRGKSCPSNPRQDVFLELHKIIASADAMKYILRPI
jgi:hypothetical protein